MSKTKFNWTRRLIPVLVGIIMLIGAVVLATPKGSDGVPPQTQAVALPRG